METTYPGCREAVMEAFRLKNVPDEAISVVLASRSEGILKQYNTALKKWWQFCELNKSNPYSDNISEIIRFLSQQFEKGMKYGTINSVRSALSLVLGPHIAEDFRLKRFLKGAHNVRPNKPKYDSTWDPQIVLKKFSNKPDNSILHLAEISKKLITLMAIITAHRMQTFSLVEISNIEFQTERVIIKIPEKIKTSGLNKIQLTLVIPYYKENCKVCVASALVSYLNKTEKIRGEEQKLFIALRKPYKAVKAQTLSHWVSDTLAAAGLDTNVYTAYSTRHAATAAADRSGISIDQIRKTEGWTKNSETFAKFYNRAIALDKNDFANAIYNTHKQTS